VTDSIVTNPRRSYDDMDTDVYNMSRWGIDFRDADYRFTDHETGTEGILGYVNMFGRMETEPNIGAPEPSPIFWAVWHDYAVSAGVNLYDEDEVARTNAQFRLDWSDPDRHYEPLADWEWELLEAGSEPIHAHLSRVYALRAENEGRQP
jgi:hypothetical protein